MKVQLVTPYRFHTLATLQCVTVRGNVTSVYPTLGVPEGTQCSAIRLSPPSPKKKLCSNTHVNGRTDEIGQFLHPAHKAAPHLAQVAFDISVFLLLPNCIDDWLRLYILTHSLQFNCCHRELSVFQEFATRIQLK